LGYSGYILRRLVSALGSTLVLVTVVFVVLRISGDPAAALLPQEASAADVARMREELGVDKPIPVQYIRFLGGLVTGDLGTSFKYKTPVVELVRERLWPTIQLSAVSFLITVSIAIPVGIAAARFRNSLLDYLLSILAFLGYSMPTFWFGLMLMILFGVRLKILPTTGYGTPRHLVLPALSLSSWSLAQLVRLVRSELLDVLSEDYVRTARAKGLSESIVLLRHAFRNVLITVVTLMGIIVGAMLAGAVVTETVFAWPGLGRMVVLAIQNRDFPLIQATVAYMAVMVVVANLVVDVLYVFIDPRVRLE
jgi:peptide/nickel transport system permease protein